MHKITYNQAIGIEAVRKYHAKFMQAQIEVDFGDSPIQYATGDVCIGVDMEISVLIGGVKRPAQSAIQICQSCPAYIGTVAYIPKVGE